MPTYRCYGVVIGSKFLGKVEANSPEEAQEKACKLDSCYIGLCWQCGREIEDPQIDRIEVEEVENHA